MSRHTEVVIVPYRDGPYLVRGPVVVRDQDGKPVSGLRRPLALCRCGKSQLRPFCDGTHQLIGFTAPSEPERRALEGQPEADQLSVPGEEPLRDALGGAGSDSTPARDCIRGALRLLRDGNPVAARSLICATLDELARAPGGGDAAVRDALGRAARELEGER